MATLRQVDCALCGAPHTKTVKQVNQAIKKRGRWACASCAGAPNRLQLAGKKFGKLTVIRQAESKEYASGSKTAWLCKCDCGNEKVVVGSELKCGKTNSCGCLIPAATSARSKTHGMSETREFRIWMAMLSRCRNGNTANYANYGGRGITVCDRWLTFENFFADMGNCPKGHSIERLDVNGNYEPANCVWADRITQARNKRNNRLLTLNGTTKCLIEWAEDLGIDQASLRERLDKWPLEKALTTPKGATA